MAENKPNERVIGKAFTDKDKAFLEPRQALINQYRLIIGDLDYVMQQYILQNVIKTHNIDVEKNTVTYDIAKDIIKVTPKVIVAK